MAQSYKIFIKDSPFIITDDQSSNEGNGISKVVRDIKNIAGFLKEQLDSRLNSETIFYNNGNPDDEFHKISQQFESVIAAGGIVWNKEKQILLIYRRGKWDLPKGKVEEGENFETAALREVQEEAGIGKLRLLNKYDETYHIYKEKEKYILKTTHWFEMLSDDDGETSPQRSEGIISARWIGRKDFESKMNKSYGSVRELMKNIWQDGYFSENEN